MTINTIDVSIYDNWSSNSNYYSNSYIKKYLEEAVKVKMGVTSVSLPKWKGKDKMSDSEIGAYDKGSLKYKKVTAYAEAVRGSYKTLRNITIDTYEASHYEQYTWMGTGDKHDSGRAWGIRPDGSFYSNRTLDTSGLQPVIN